MECHNKMALYESSQVFACIMKVCEHSLISGGQSPYKMSILVAFLLLPNIPSWNSMPKYWQLYESPQVFLV